GNPYLSRKLIGKAFIVCPADDIPGWHRKTITRVQFGRVPREKSGRLIPSRKQDPTGQILLRRQFNEPGNLLNFVADWPRHAPLSVPRHRRDPMSVGQNPHRNTVTSEAAGDT